LRLLLFGNYSTGDGYPRLRVLAEGLRGRGVEVLECRVPLLEEEGARTRAAGSPLAFLRAGAAAAKARLALRKAYREAPPHDAVLVGYPGALAVGVARRGNRDRRRPVVRDAFLSLYDTAVNDRRLAGPRSLRARLLRRLDRSSCAAADRVLVDTEENARWFEEELGVAREKLAVVPVGALPFPADLPGPAAPPPPARPLEVLFFGTYVPLQGATVILEAAARLRAGVRITLVGRGQDLPAAKERASSLGLGPPRVRWVEELIPRAALDLRIAAADVCLGIFGTTDKAARVVPCKVHDALAAGKPLVTAGGPAARALIRDGEHALLVPPGDPGALAGALERLRDDGALRERLSAGALRLWRERLAPVAVAGRFEEALEWGRPGTA
jgi:glycosyltransferase involved in cell wall biosynthesis